MRTEAINSFLEHFGVRGMHWGIRKPSIHDGNHKAAEGKKEAKHILEKVGSVKAAPLEGTTEEKLYIGRTDAGKTFIDSRRTSMLTTHVRVERHPSSTSHRWWEIIDALPSN